MNWDDFDAFCQVVEHGGFTAAARALDRPKSSLSASVTRLEEQLGARLLERTTRSLRLTEAGESLYRDISKPFAAAARSCRGRGRQGRAGAGHAAHRGALRVRRAPPGRGRLPDHGRASAAEGAPGRGARARAAVRAALRHRVLVDRAQLRAVEHRDAPRVLAGTRAVRRAPAAGGPASGRCRAGRLARDCLCSRARTTPTGSSRGRTEPPPRSEVRNPRMRSGNAGVRLEAALAGLGVARITATFCARGRPARAGSCRCCPHWRCAPLRIYALLPGRRLMPAKVRAFLDRSNECRRTKAA